MPVDFDALWLGGRIVGERKDYSEHLLKVKGMTGTYGYLINSAFIPIAVQALSKRNKLADWALSSVFRNVYKSKKNLVKHRNGFSIIKNKAVYYPDLA